MRRELLTVERALLEAGLLLEANTKAAAIASGVPKQSRLIESVNLEGTDADTETATIVINQYFRFVELGRRAGAKLPPVEPILDWMVRYRVAPGREKQVVWAIRRAIAVRGIKARPFLNKALALTEKQLEETLTAQLQVFIQSIVI